MTPDYGHDPTDPRAQRQPPAQQPQGQQPQAQQPPGQHSQNQQPQGQQPQGQHSQGQQPPASGVGGQPRQSQPGPVGQPPQSGHLGTPQRQAGAHSQQQMGFSQGGPAPGGPNPPRAPQAPPLSGGMQAQIPPQPQQQWQQQPQQPQQRRRSGQQFLRPVTVDNIAAEDVVTAERDTPISTAIASMAENDVGSVVVVEDDEPVGVLTDRKVALALEDTPEVAQQTVGDLVSEELVTVDSSTTVFEVVKMMGDNGIRRVPVVNEEGNLQGIVTLDDAIVLLGTELGNVAETIQAQIDRL